MTLAELSSASNSVVHFPQTDKNKQCEFAFGAMIHKYRTQNGLNQPKHAKLLGVPRKTITNWENDRAR